MSEKLTSALIQSPTGGLFSTLSVDGSGIVIKNASDDTRSDGTFVPAGSDTLVLSAVGESSFLNASYMKVGVLDASLMRTGLLQTVASWNSKWYGSSADSMDVQQGFSGGKYTPSSVSTTTNTITLSNLQSPSAGSHNITTSDYVRVSGLVFDVSGDDLYGNVGVDSPGSGVMDYADVTSVTASDVTFTYNGIGSGRTTLNKYSIPFISKVIEISSISRVYDDGATDDNPGELSTVTVNTASAHGLSTGNYVELHGVEDSLNGVWRVSSAPTSTQFTFMQRFVEDLDWENDGSVTLPEYGAPVAIEVAKSYRVTSDGTLLAYGAVFNPAGQRRSAILLQGDATQGDIAVPADGTLHIGYRNGTDGLGGTFTTIMKINTPASGTAADTTIYGTVTVDVLNATTINGGTATSSGNVRIRQYEDDGTSANKRGEIEWYTQVASSSAFTSQVITYSDKDYPNSLVVDPNIKVLGNADVVGTLSVGSFNPTTISAATADFNWLEVGTAASSTAGLFIASQNGWLTVNNQDNATSPTSGAVVVKGGIGVGKDLNVAGTVNADSINVTTFNPTTISAATAEFNWLEVGTAVSAVDGLFVASQSGLVTVNSTQASSGTSTGAVVVKGGVGVGKDVWAANFRTDGTVSAGTVTGVFSGNVANATSVSATTITASTADISNWLEVGTAASATAGLFVASAAGWLTINNTDQATSATTGAVVIKGGLGVGKDIWADNFKTNGGTAGSGMLVAGTVQANALSVNSFTPTTVTASTADFDWLQVGTASAATAGWFVASQSGLVTINNNTPSSSTSTGALVIKGGMGVAEDLWAGNVKLAGGTPGGGTIQGGLVNAGTVNTQALNVTTFSPTTISASTADFNWLQVGTASSATAAAGWVVASQSGWLTVNNQDNATSLTSGAAVIKGGLGVGKDLRVGGTIFGAIDFAPTSIRLTSSADASLTSTAHPFTITNGTAANHGTRIMIDNNEILAANGADISTLLLQQDQGYVRVSSSADGEGFSGGYFTVGPRADASFPTYSSGVSDEDPDAGFYLSAKGTLFATTYQGSAGGSNTAMILTTRYLTSTSWQALKIYKRVANTNTTPTQVGTITVDNTANPTLTRASDYRIKNTIEDAHLSFDFENIIMSLKPRTFYYNDIEPDKKQLGWVAHEVSPYIKGAVYGEKDAVDESGEPIHQQMSDAPMMPYVVGALQKMIDKVSDLETRVAELEGSA